MLNAAAMDVLNMSMCLYYDILSARRATLSESWQQTFTLKTRLSSPKFQNFIVFLQVFRLHIFIHSAICVQHKSPRFRIWNLFFVSPGSAFEFATGWWTLPPAWPMAFWWQPIKIPISHRLPMTPWEQCLGNWCALYILMPPLRLHANCETWVCLLLVGKETTCTTTQQLKHLTPKEWWRNRYQKQTGKGPRQVRPSRCQYHISPHKSNV